MRTPPAGGPLHPHVALLQGVAATLAWCLATPVALWLACGVLAPIGCALAGHPDWLAERLLTVAASEAADARMATPALTVPWWGAAAQGWPWQCSAAWCGRMLPDDVASAAVAPMARPGRPTLVTMWERMAARPWHGDQSVHRLLASIACTRGLYALAVVLGMLPFVGMCWCLGVPSSTPQARRARWWLMLLRQALAGLAAACALPICIATVPLLLALVVLAGGALTMLRRQTPADAA